MNNTQKGVLVLMKSAITEKSYPLPEGFSIEEAYDFIMRHKIMMLAYDGAVRCGISSSEPAMKKLFQSYVLNMLRSEKQMEKTDGIYKAFEENGIDYLPLKGCNMKALYPKPELRFMGDADILIREKQYPEIKAILESMGFEGKDEAGHHYEWKNEDFLAEIHIMPMSKGFAKFYDYYGDGWSRAIKTESRRYVYSREDEFIFSVVHLAKHYLYSGVGCRHAADIYVFLRAFPDMDFAYIENEFEKLGIRDFYKNLLKMIEFWFEEGEADETVGIISEYILKSGNWGDFETYSLGKGLREIKNEKTETAKGKFIIKTIFPSASELSGKYKILKKAPFLLPLIWPVRWIGVLLFKRKKIDGKLKYLDFIETEKVDAHRKNLEKAGFRF